MISVDFGNASPLAWLQLDHFQHGGVQQENQVKSKGEYLQTEFATVRDDQYSKVWHLSKRYSINSR